MATQNIMDEENGTDSEREGADGLKLLATRVVSEEVKQKSVAMTPLVPAQKRSRAPSRDIGDNDQPLSIQKVEGDTPAGRSKPWGMVRREEGQRRDIHERRSAPHHGSTTLERELRSCRSAPNLALPALQATVRGLQDGTIQVDRHTRLQIASAAKRVLEAREAKRRLSQEQEGLPTSTSGRQEAGPALATPRSSKPQEKILTAELGPTLSNADKVAEAPTSLATAAAIARGESLPMGPPAPLTRVSSDAATAPMQFHKPAALGTARMGGSLVTSPHKHTVTTGLPKFCEGQQPASPGSKLEGALMASLARQPLVPRSSHSASSLQRVPSKTLTVNDLFKNEGPASKVRE